MKLKTFLKPLDTPGIQCKIYMNYKCGDKFEADCVYSGSMWNIPYHLVDYQIGYCAGDTEVEGEPIFWALLDGDEKGACSDTYGFVINLKEEEEN